MLRNNPLALILLVLVVLSLTVLVAQMAGWGRNPPTLGTVQGDLTGIPTLQAVTQDHSTLPDAEVLEKITARPLLSPDRAPEMTEQAEDNQEPVAEMVVNPVQARLTSVVITPEGRYAIVHDTKAKQRLILEPGMPLEGDQGAWVLSQVEARKVVFSAGEGKTAELELDIFARPLPAESKKSPAARPSGNATTDGRDKQRETVSSGQPGRVSAEEIRRKIAERRAQLRAEAAKRNNK